MKLPLLNFSNFSIAKLVVNKLVKVKLTLITFIPLVLSIVNSTKVESQLNFTMPNHVYSFLFPHKIENLINQSKVFTNFS